MHNYLKYPNQPNPMTKSLLIIFAVLFVLRLPAQNLLTNPDAESIPRGTGWTIISQGALTCLSNPTDNIVNWTMKPDGSANYPYDHTTGAIGGTVFFSGCSSFFGGPFELQQSIDVSADAVTIDLGSQLYTFSGYMQTPVSNQTDQGRFIVDYLNGSNTVLGTSYASNWQSFSGGSGTAWTNYSNTRVAPAGTRMIRVRMLTQIVFNQPAINVYFDDISLTKPFVLPLSLVSFTAKDQHGSVHLNWTFSEETRLQQLNVERSFDGIYFNSITSFPVGKTNYYFVDNNYPIGETKCYYRLKMTTTEGKVLYSNILPINLRADRLINLSPNPANDKVTVNGSFPKGTITIINSGGQKVLNKSVNAISFTLDISGLPSGIYMVCFSDQTNTVYKKLVIQPK